MVVAGTQHTARRQWGFDRTQSSDRVAGAVMVCVVCAGVLPFLKKYQFFSFFTFGGGWRRTGNTIFKRVRLRTYAIGSRCCVYFRMDLFFNQKQTKTKNKMAKTESGGGRFSDVMWWCSGVDRRWWCGGFVVWVCGVEY